MTISVPQIAAQLEAVLAREPAALAVAIRSPAKQDWPEAIMQRGRRFSLRWSDSMLAMREALCDVEQAEGADAGLVVLTPLRSNEIAEDIAARLARGRVFQPEGWAIVRQLFGAKEIDARLGRYAWMPQVLVDGALKQLGRKAHLERCGPQDEVCVDDCAVHFEGCVAVDALAGGLDPTAPAADAVTKRQIAQVELSDRMAITFQHGFCLEQICIKRG